MKKIILLTTLLLGLTMIVSAVAPVLAKDFNLPEGVNIIYTTGGVGTVTVPASWPVGGIHPAQLRMTTLTAEAGTLGPAAANLEIDIPYTAPDGSAAWLPIVYFTTGSNPNLVPWTTMIMSGLPAAMLPGNIRVLSNDVLKVDRQGNTIQVELTTPQTVLWLKPGTGVVSATIPAFSIQLDKIGGSIHTDSTVPLTGYPGASGWIGNIHHMGFNANGVFTSTGWNSEMTDCFIVMHGITTWTPP